MRFITDTHSLLWYLEDHPRLSPTSKLLFDQQERGRIVIPTIVLAELLFIARKVKLPIPFEETLKFLEREERFEIHPLEAEIIRKAIPLKHLEMHDALIVATALSLKVPLMTVDREIADSQLVEILEP